jgi:hypothetical protein
MRPVKTVPGIGGGELKENDGGSEFKFHNWANVKQRIQMNLHDNFPSS